MCCEPRGYSHHSNCICNVEHRPQFQRTHHHDCICDAGQYQHFSRRFLSKEERVARLSEYKEELSRELGQIKERIDSIKKE